MDNSTGAKSLKDIIDGKEFIIPLYQRNYKWNKEVAGKLADDIISCFIQGNTIQKTIGLLTLYKEDNSDNCYYVIDGQQRFTTLCILLSLLKSKTNIRLTFDRDEEKKPKRSDAIANESTDKGCTDVNRIHRNKSCIQEVINTRIGEDQDSMDELADYVLNNVIMLCSVVTEFPVAEFMNLNAYKTAFSISDQIRANLIALNSFHKKEMESERVSPILAKCLSRHSYKTAVAILYNNIQLKLYNKEEKNYKDIGPYSDIYKLLKTETVIDPEKESHINILFGGMLKKNAENYFSGDITKNFDEWIQILQKLAHINHLLEELENEMKNGEYHSFKQIDDYQDITKKSFIQEVFGEIVEQKEYLQTLAEELQRHANITSVLLRCMKDDERKLANRYLEALAYSTVNRRTIKKADSESRVKLPQLTMDEVVEEISGCGRYILNRYEAENREDLNVTVYIPPVLNLNDEENKDFGGTLDVDNDEISVGKLFEYSIKIPVIQRDYCMGARITGANDFLAFLLNGFEKKKELMTSTILVSVTNDKNTLYIFDGQQRSFTLYNILKYCGEELKDYEFVGRINENNESIPCGSPYSKEAVDNLNEILKKYISDNDKKDFADYIKTRIKLKAKVVTNVSGAEQFFMDINGGVALKSYEIYKAMLCNRLANLKLTYIVRKIENDWLDYFYNFRKQYLKVNDIEHDETDEEELLEIRFIEYICRFVYRIDHQTEGLLLFDEIETKGEIVAKLVYINNLTKEHMKMVETIMDSVCLLEQKDGNTQCTLIKGIIDTNSAGGKLHICHIQCCSNKKYVLQNKEYYISRFIWSLSNINRRIIKNYYRYGKIASLGKIYDDDLIMRDILNSLLADYPDSTDQNYPYNIMSMESLILYGGYKNGKYEGNYYEYTNHPEKEVPAYYVKEICDSTSEILRLQYLYDKAKKGNENKPLYFALVENGMKYEDEKSCKAIQINGEIEWTKWYDIYYIRFRGEGRWTKVTNRSAYLFRYNAKDYVKKHELSDEK